MEDGAVQETFASPSPGPCAGRALLWHRLGPSSSRRLPRAHPRQGNGPPAMAKLAWTSVQRTTVKTLPIVSIYE